MQMDEESLDSGDEMEKLLPESDIRRMERVEIRTISSKNRSYTNEFMVDESDADFEIADEFVNPYQPEENPASMVSDNADMAPPCATINVAAANTNRRRTYTVEDAVEAAGFGLFQARIVCICGILTASDAMEMLLLSVLGPALRCEWHLSSSEIAIITTVVFIGFLFGAPFWGMISDKYGRWTTFSSVLIVIAYFGMITSLSPSYSWVIFLRGVVGFGIGGGASSFTLMSEYLPNKYRAKILIGYQISWAIGSTAEIALAYLILPRYGWRWLVVASAIPIASFLLLMKFLPESARFLMAAGRKSEAARVLTKMVRINKASLPDGDLVALDTNEPRGHVKHLIAPAYRWTTSVLLPLWFGVAFTYYGIILISAEIFRFHHSCFGERIGVLINGTTETVVDNSCCIPITNDDYTAMLISSFGEFVIIPINMLLIDLIGRRWTMATGYGFTAIFFGMLYLCIPKSATTVLLFIIRALVSGSFNTIYIYTTEVYPTVVRSLGIGVCSSVARLGAMTTPYVAQVVMPDISVLAALMIYAVLNAVCAIGCVILPIETKGRALPQSVDQPQSVSAVRYRRSSPNSVHLQCQFHAE